MRGRYDEGEGPRLYIANDLRARGIMLALSERVTDLGCMWALGFCVGVAHSEFMADQFCRAGIPTLAITGKTPREVRDDAVRKLQAREVNVLFTIDVFNEGVDIPEADTVLFLRPTESATVFLQQLGRGPRLHREKECLTVLDFIGNARREFRFDLRFRGWALRAGEWSTRWRPVFPFCRPDVQFNRTGGAGRLYSTACVRRWASSQAPSFESCAGWGRMPVWRLFFARPALIDATSIVLAAASWTCAGRPGSRCRRMARTKTGLSGRLDGYCTWMNPAGYVSTVERARQEYGQSLIA